MSQYRDLWRTIKTRLKKSSDESAATRRLPLETHSESFLNQPHDLLARLREYLFSPDEPDAHLNPKWLAVKFQIGERELLDALAYAVLNGMVDLHWEVFCPACGARPAEFSSLKEAHSHIDCPGCGNDFDLHLDRDVRVTFSATESLRRTRGDKSISLPIESDDHTPTRGLDLLLAPAFENFFPVRRRLLTNRLESGTSLPCLRICAAQRRFTPSAATRGLIEWYANILIF